MNLFLFRMGLIGARSGMFAWGTMLQADSVPGEVIYFFNWTNASSRTMVLGSTQPPTEINTRNLPDDKDAAGA
jgi:hypothetical protein